MNMNYFSFNAILNPDRTLKNRVAVNEATARSVDCPIDILPEDIFIENAPPIPDGLHTPQLLADWQAILEADPQAVVWVEANTAGKEAELLAEAVARKKTAIADAMTATLAAGYTCSNSITMDATEADIDRLDKGYRLAQSKGETAMDIRDYYNVRHMGIATLDVDVMIQELGVNWRNAWGTKCLQQEALQAIIDRTALPASDPNHLTTTDATAAVEALAI